MNYTDINAETIDRWVKKGWEWGVPITHEQYVKAQNGQWQVLLTPTKAVPADWFPELKDLKLLGLASGGGQQMPIFSALKAQCTVLDYSQKQIDTEKMIADREGYNIITLRADMTKGLPFPDESFDMIFHPVANCFIEDVLFVWKECYRVLKKGGTLLAGLDNGINFLYDENETELKYHLPFNPLKNPALIEVLKQDDSGIQFSHTLEEQIRGQLKTGFTIVDLYEDYNGYGLLHEHGVPTFWATLAKK